MATIKEKMEAGGFTTGFDYLRIGLSIAVLVWHSFNLSDGSHELDVARWSGPWRFLPASIIPMFFALSGFLVTGSLLRVRLHQFITLRLVRLIPALAVEVTLSALIIGVAFTTLPIGEYLCSPEVRAYFLNIVGVIQYELPGVFVNNPNPLIINSQLWTIPFELECYAALIFLSVTGIVRVRAAFVAALLVLGIALTAQAVLTHNIRMDTSVPGRSMVMAFLIAVAVYLYRDRIPVSPVWGAASLVISAFLLGIPECVFLAMVPLVYATVWLGLMRPPPIPFGDLSYGVYLFHYPIEQTLVHLFPALRTPWALSLTSLPITAVFAWLSWTLIERPLLLRKKSILKATDRVFDATIGRWLGFAKARLAAISN
ncbi:MAG: acyltransferase family protein [Janthinobacterium lividum]